MLELRDVEMRAGTVRLPELDMLRFAAAFSVLAYHYVSCYVPADELESSGLAALSAVTRYGYLGVNLFFIISGYVILWSALGRSASEFAVGRFVRLYPTFWVALGLAVAALAVSVSLGQVDSGQLPSVPKVIANATMWPSLLGFSRIDDVYWTLEIELRFYVLIFLLTLFRLQRRVEALLYLWLAVLVVGRVVDLPKWLSFLAIETYGPYFVLGSLLFMVRAGSLTPWRASALAVASFLALHESIVGRGGFITADSISSVVCPAVVAAMIGYLLYLALRDRRVVGSQAAERLGALTYPLYLTHAGVGGVVLAALLPAVGPPVAVGLATAFALALAYALTSLVDIPVRRPLRRILIGWLDKLSPSQRKVPHEH